MGKLADATRAAMEPRNGPKCHLSQAMASLDEEGQTDLQSLLDDLQVYGSVICEQLVEVFDIHIRPEALNRHRAGRCACDKAKKPKKRVRRG